MFITRQAHVMSITNNMQVNLQGLTSCWPIWFLSYTVLKAKITIILQQNKKSSYFPRHNLPGSILFSCPLCLVSPPESDSLRSGLKFYPWCFFIYFFSTREISEMRGPTGVKFCTMVSTRPNFIMLVQNFGARAAKKFQGPKTCKIWLDFERLRSSAANISETDEDIQNQIIIPSMAIRPALGKTSTAKFGPVTLEI